VDHLRNHRLTRRDLQRLALIAPAPLAAAIAMGHLSGLALAQDDAATPDADGPLVLAPTPACGDDDDFATTQPQTEGPFYTPETPERMSLREEGDPGTPLLLTGYVYSADCQPISGALLDFWHADDSGVYDNEGYRYRGHQFADEDGRYELLTILPGLYPGRTRHIHVKAQPPNGPVLTTQIYFPGEPDNERDGIFDERLLVDLDEEGGELVAFFTFVLATG
jgi:protocatechuate 3,4-dioxygenase beta subunit